MKESLQMCAAQPAMKFDSFEIAREIAKSQQTVLEEAAKKYEELKQKKKESEA